jgi:photosystem II stability/assembly factor-like uncharacterized protein
MSPTSLLQRVAMFAVIPLLGAGCLGIQIGGGSTEGLGGGIFRSADRGATWEARGAIPTTTGPQSLHGVNIRGMEQDPQDPRALYVSTDGNGGFVSWDHGDSWRSLGTPFARARVETIAVHPRSTCTLYVAAGQRVFASTDCARSWRSSDFEFAVAALAVDPLATSRLYAATTAGALLVSSDHGSTWTALHRFGNPVSKFTIAPPVERGGSVTMYVGLANGSIMRSESGGTSWVDLRDKFIDFPGAFDLRDLDVAADAPHVLIHASRYGLLRSVDRGNSWADIPLLSAPGAATITTVAIDPRNRNVMYYTTSTTLYKTLDGGVTWESRSLPAGSGSALLVDADPALNGSVLWLGARGIK